MRITLEEIIERHKKSNPNTDYDYGKTVLGQTLHDKVIITCPIHGDFIQAPHEHMKGQGCPKCAIEQKAINKRTDIEELIRKSKEKFGNKFNYEITRRTYKNIKGKCSFHCNDCGNDFEFTFFRHFKNMTGGCKVCKEKMLSETRERKEKEKQNKQEIRLKAKIKREKQEELRKQKREIREKEWEEKRIEKAKKKEEIKRKREFLYSKEHLKEVFLEKAIKANTKGYDLSHIKDYVNSTTPVPMYCHQKDEFGNEHGIFMVRPDGFLRGQGCPKCAKKYSYNGEELLVKFIYTHGDKYMYKNLDGKRMTDHIDIFCKTCNRWFSQTVVTHLNNHGCPFCCSSRLENTIDVFLNKHNIEYNRQQKFEWLGQQSLDFYLIKYNIAIECQGSQHFIPSEKFGGEKNFNYSQERDKRKKRLCKENGVELIYFLDKKYNSYMKEDDIYFNKKEDLLKYIKFRLDNIIKK